MDRYFKNTKLKGMKKEESEELLRSIREKVDEIRQPLILNDRFYRVFWVAAAAVFLFLVFGNIYIERSYLNYTVKEFHACPDTECRLEMLDIARQMGLGSPVNQKGKDKTGGQNG